VDDVASATERGQVNKPINNATKPRIPNKAQSKKKAGQIANRVNSCAYALPDMHHHKRLVRAALFSVGVE
jgi:hypothetical protein